MTFDPSSLKFNDAGLIPAITQDATSGEVLMMAWMNAESIAQTLSSGEVTYWSRSRQEFWVKGATSGHTQQLVDFKIDCDHDCILIEVNQIGAACHTGRRTCFYTAIRNGEEIEITAPKPQEDPPSV